MRLFDFFQFSLGLKVIIQLREAALLAIKKMQKARKEAESRLETLMSIQNSLNQEEATAAAEATTAGAEATTTAEAEATTTAAEEGASAPSASEGEDPTPAAVSQVTVCYLLAFLPFGPILPVFLLPDRPELLYSGPFVAGPLGDGTLVARP